MNIKTLITPVFALTGWLLTIILVMQLLGGTFDTRSCTTVCMQILYWTAFSVTAVGLIIGGLQMKNNDKNLPSLIGLVALAVLMLIFVVTMAVGTFLYA